MSLRPEL